MKKSLFSGVLGLFVLAVVFAFGPSVSQASAACDQIGLSTAGAPRHADGYYYSQEFRTRSSSTCSDINIRDLTGYFCDYGRAYMRVRFYPSSGGSDPKGWKIVDSYNSDNEDFEIATDVLNGTRFRVEWQEAIFSCSPQVFFTLRY